MDEGLEKGRKEGQLTNQRENIVDLLIMRFAPPPFVYRHIEKQLRQITDLEPLEELFTLAVQCDTVDIFQTTLDDLTTI